MIERGKNELASACKTGQKVCMKPATSHSTWIRQLVYCFLQNTSQILILAFYFSGKWTYGNIWYSIVHYISEAFSFPTALEDISRNLPAEWVVARRIWTILSKIRFDFWVVLCDTWSWTLLFLWASLNLRYFMILSVNQQTTAVVADVPTSLFIL